MAEGAQAQDAGLAAENAESAADVAAGPDDALFGYIERFASVLVSAGFPPMPARVFVALLVTTTPTGTTNEAAALAVPVSGATAVTASMIGCRSTPDTGCFCTQ